MGYTGAGGLDTDDLRLGGSFGQLSDRLRVS